MLTCYNQATTGRQNILLNIITITIILSAGRDHWVSLCRYVRFPPFPRLVIAFCRAVCAQKRAYDHAGKVFCRFPRHVIAFCRAGGVCALTGRYVRVALFCLLRGRAAGGKGGENGAAGGNTGKCA